MAIQIRKKLTKEQYIKLFSNPVSGIVCNILYPVESNLLQNIRYSKSMILNSLYFWEKQYDRYLELLKKAQFNPLFVNTTDKNNEILKTIMFVHNLPDTFLFSHRHIQDAQKGGGRYPNPINQQLTLLDKKYPNLIKKCSFYGIQNQTMDPYFMIKTTIGIEFSIFPCEHPYIEKQKISKVGITDKGNVYILHPVGKKK